MCFCVKETFTYVPGNDLLQLLSMIFGNLFIRFLFSSMNKYSLSMAFAFCETWINSMLSCWLPELISVYLWWILLSTSPSRCMRVLMSVQWDESSHGMKISSFWEQKKHIVTIAWVYHKDFRYVFSSNIFHLKAQSLLRLIAGWQCGSFSELLYFTFSYLFLTDRLHL